MTWDRTMMNIDMLLLLSRGVYNMLRLHSISSFHGRQTGG